MNESNAIPADEPRTVRHLVDLAVTTLAPKRQYPWAADTNKLYRAANKTFESIAQIFPNAVVEMLHGVYRIKLGKHDHDDRANPAPDYFFADGLGHLYPRSA